MKYHKDMTISSSRAPVEHFKAQSCIIFAANDIFYHIS